MERLVAGLSDRYAIKRELGRGGMATVYLAVGVRHHRDGARTGLRPELAAGGGGGR
jgi:serine/threonine-protein kinase